MMHLGLIRAAAAATLLVALSTPMARAQDCARGAASCQDLVTEAACLGAVGAGAVAAPDDCGAQIDAYRRCIQDFATQCATTAAGRQDAFIGALDGEYRQEDGFMLVQAEEARSEMTFLAGNCAFTVKLSQENRGWEGALTRTDGVCSFLEGLEPNAPLVRVIPKPRALANSGRVLAFYLETRAFALESFAGDYALK